MILGGDNLILYQTNITQDFDQYEFFMRANYPELEFQIVESSLSGRKYL